MTPVADEIDRQRRALYRDTAIKPRWVILGAAEFARLALETENLGLLQGGAFGSGSAAFGGLEIVVSSRPGVEVCAPATLGFQRMIGSTPGVRVDRWETARGEVVEIELEYPVKQRTYRDEVSGRPRAGGEGGVTRG